MLVNATDLTNKKAMLSQGNRAMPLWILIDIESAGTLLEQYQSVECSQSVDAPCMRKYSMSEEAQTLYWRKLESLGYIFVADSIDLLWRFSLGV